jgi:mono/diheme cytochrome c family protein
MHYPWWYVPGLTAPMLIAVIAVLHVLVSHYAVGGGLFLATEVSYAYRTRNRPLLEYLRTHAWFFILITVVYGAVTGVGIWWTIGLASPLPTELLIHTFVFGWAMEYVFFVIEITAAFIFFYYWGRLDPKTHQIVGWLYAGSAWVSLVLITAITGFMLDPGAWLAGRTFWRGFLNPQFVPQVLARTGGALLLASLYVYLHASIRAKDQALRDLLGRRSSRPALLGSILILLGGALWYVVLPAPARAALSASSVLNVLMVLIFVFTTIVFVMLYLGPYRNPRWVTTGFAALFLALGLAATTTGEYIREAVRKPYVIHRAVFSNGVYPEDVARLRQDGYLESGTWTKAYVTMRYPQLLDPQGRIDRTRFAALDEDVQADLGRIVFQYQCNSCHSISGYSGIQDLTRGWTPDVMRTVIDNLNQMHFFMPPWQGTPEEADVLVKYLQQIRLPSPHGRAPVTSGQRR